MKSECTLVLVLIVTAGCNKHDPENSSTRRADSTKLVSAYLELEKVMWDYYRSIEKDVRMDLGVSETEIIERVQTLIDEGYVKEPAILIFTKDGPTWETVNYSTYKDLMARHAVASRRYHGIQPAIQDSASVDSIRSSLLEALEGDSATLPAHIDAADN